MSSLHLRPGHTWTARSTVLAGIVVVHVAAVAVAMLAKGPQPEVAQASPISVSLLTESAEQPPAPPQLVVRPEQVQLPNPVLPVIQFAVEQAAPAPITMAAVPAPAVAEVAAPRAQSHEPLIATTVEYVRRPVAVYPAAAKRARATGTVQVRALVETDGKVREVNVYQSSGHAALDRAACDSVRGALFRPYMRDGVARAALVIVPIEFSLTVRTASR